MSETSEKTPEWLVLLENKKKRHNRLAHEIGAGAPCLNCGDSCPGLDLHFWRKLCRNCKCKKEDHDVKDDEGYEQFEILLGPGSKKRKRGACLNIKVPEIETGIKQPKSSQVPFDWVPPNVSDDVAVEYMNQLPTAKLPISGSDGALYRRQQLERQVPIHDLDASRCHNLTPQEVEGLKKYLENLKSNVVGQGRVTKVPLHYAEVHWASGDGPYKSLPASQSADSIHSIPPPTFSAPRPFQPTGSHNLSVNDDELLPPPPPLPKTLPPSLKKPSNFVPSWKSYNNPESQIAYSEMVPGKPSFTSTEHKKPEFSADHIATEWHSHNKLLGDAAYHQYTPVPDESAATLPVDGTISMIMNPRNMSFSATVPRASNAMKAVPLSQGSAVSGVVNKQSIPFAKDAAVPSAEIIAESRHPSGGGRYIKDHTGSLLSEDSAQLLKATDAIQWDNAVQGTFQPEVTNSFSRQPGLALHSDAINVKNPNSEALTTHFEEASAFPGRKTHDIGLTLYSDALNVKTPNSAALTTHFGEASTFPGRKTHGTAQSIDHTADIPSAFASVSSHKQGVGISAGLQKFPLNTSIPVKYMLDDVNNAVHGKQKGVLAGSISGRGDTYGMADPLAAKSTIYSSLGPHGETVYSEGVPTDALPKSALAMQQHRQDLDVVELTGHMAEMKTDDDTKVQQPQFSCKECEGTILAGDVAVFADRAGQDVAWHPSCFVCTTCKELLVDLIYFFNKGRVYCGRHYAELLKIPRCFACDELIFVNEYTMAEGQAFHVKHFCCYECDIPLGGMKYVPVDGQPVCLDCFQEKYGKSCHACGQKIGASEQRVSWKDLHWHVTGDCFSCFSCRKSLLGGRFVVKQNQPFCSKECVLASGVL